MIVPILAHGIAGRGDLPVPTSFFVGGAAVAVIVSFVLLAVLWKEPRWQTVPSSRAITKPLPRLGLVMRGIGVVGLAFVVVAGIVNGRSRDSVLSPVTVWIYFWLVIPFLSVFLGGIWHHLNPWRTLASLLNRSVPERGDLATRLGLWPATAVFMGFIWLELVVRTNTEPRVLALAAIAYTAYVLTFTRLVGVETGLSSGDAFGVYNELVGDVAPGNLVSGEDRQAGPAIVRTGWLRLLPGIQPRAGLAAFVVAMIGSVTFDGASESQWWIRTFSSVEREEWFRTLGLLSTVLAVGAAFWLASLVAARLGGRAHRPLEVARSFAHTLVPIAIAYAFAHYFTLVVFEGQQFLHALSDPFGYGWNLFGTADWRVNFWLSANSIWYVQVTAIVLGHVAGVVLAHDRALAVFPAERAVRTQYAMLALMVGLTALGLLVLSG